MPDLRICYRDENGNACEAEFDTVMDFLDGPFLFDKDAEITYWELFGNPLNSGRDTTFGWLYAHCDEITR